MKWQRLIYHPEVNYALRQTLVLCLPAALGFALGELRLGLMFSLIPACCNIASLDTPHQHFFRRLIVGGTLFTFSSFLTQQLLLWDIPLPVVMLGLALTLGVSGAISQLNGRLLPAALIAAIFSLSMVGRAPIWQAPLMCAVGTLWYGVFTWLWFRLCKDQPSALRDAGRMGVTLAAGSYIGSLIHLPKPYWILLTIMLVTQNGYNATKIRIHHRAMGTLIGLLLAAALLHFQMPEGTTLSIMLLITLIAYLVQRKNYGWSVIFRTITTVYILQLLTGEGADFLVPRLLDTLIGCALAFASALWLWPQWQSGLLRKNAHQALESYQKILRILLKPNPDIGQLSYERIQVNKASNAVLSSLNQAMQEPGFNSKYLADMRLWATHSELIVGHINEMTILTRAYPLEESPPESDKRHIQLTVKLAEEYLQLCEMAIQQCQQRLESDNSEGNNDFVQMPDIDPDTQISESERNLRRILSHLSVMHTVSSLAWQQQPHHGIWRWHKLYSKA